MQGVVRTGVAKYRGYCHEQVHTPPALYLICCHP